MEKLWSP